MDGYDFYATAPPSAAPPPPLPSAPSRSRRRPLLVSAVTVLVVGAVAGGVVLVRHDGRPQALRLDAPAGTLPSGCRGDERVTGQWLTRCTTPSRLMRDDGVTRLVRDTCAADRTPGAQDYVPVSPPGDPVVAFSGPDLADESVFYAAGPWEETAGGNGLFAFVSHYPVPIEGTTLVVRCFLPGPHYGAERTLTADELRGLGLPV